MSDLNEKTSRQTDFRAEMHAHPKEFIRDFYEEMQRAIHPDDSDADVVDRFHTPDVIQVADGVTMDRERLIAHLRPIRRALVPGGSRFEVHEAIAAGDALAARFTIHAEFNQRVVVTDVHFFGHFAPDGRLRSAHQFTNTRKQATT